ncbi:MAG: regulator SirB [Halothiobacillaceae bacterium]|nr:MAG: regulator SirB [Halothiobacillaceae bacterium]
MSVSAIIHLHGLFVTLSLIGFITRGWWMLRDCPALQARWVKIAPHVIDTLLLVTALWAAWSLFWSNGTHPAFITVKIVGLLVYIALGTIALKRGKTKAIRVAAFVGALAVFAYLMAVGVTMQVLPFVG